MGSRQEQQLSSFIMGNPKAKWMGAALVETIEVEMPSTIIWIELPTAGVQCEALARPEGNPGSRKRRDFFWQFLYFLLYNKPLLAKQGLENNITIT